MKKHMYTTIIVPTNEQALLKPSKPRAASGTPLPILGLEKSNEIQTKFQVQPSWMKGCWDWKGARQGTWLGTPAGDPFAGPLLSQIKSVIN